VLELLEPDPRAPSAYLEDVVIHRPE